MLLTAIITFDFPIVNIDHHLFRQYQLKPNINKMANDKAGYIADSKIAL